MSEQAGTDARSTFKPKDVEELIDWYLNRPLASLFVAVLKRTAIRPNQVTVLSGIVGIIAGLFLGFASPQSFWMAPVAGMLLFVAVLLDCSDGQLARLRGESSMVGRALDGVIDIVPTTGAFVGFAFFLLAADFSHWLVWPLGWAAGFSIKFHAEAYDHEKNLYLHNTRGPRDGGGSLMPTYEEIAAEQNRLREAGDRIGVLILYVFIWHTRDQRKHQDQRLGMERRSMETPRERAIYRETYLGHMRLWTWLGLGTHLALFILAMLVAPWVPVGGLVVWFIFLVPMNLLMFFLRSREKMLDERVLQRIGDAEEP